MKVDLRSGNFIQFTETGFFELILKYTNPLNENDTIVFTTRTEEREDSEWGIRTWGPDQFDQVQIGAEEV